MPEQASRKRERNRGWIQYYMDGHVRLEIRFRRAVGSHEFASPSIEPENRHALSGRQRARAAIEHERATGNHKCWAKGIAEAAKVQQQLWPD